MNDYELAAWYVWALTGSVDTVMDWRVIHDKDKGESGRNIRGTLADKWAELGQYNKAGWGVFVTINELDGVGRELENVRAIRAHVIDLDNTLTAQANYEQAGSSGASFAVQSSEGKYHVYWRMQPYAGNDFYKLIQRKLAQLYDGDKSIIDATRVMRVPGFYNNKYETPTRVNCWQLDRSWKLWAAEEIQASVTHVNIFDHISTRSPLGDEEKKAPSFEWLKYALELIDPNDLSRDEWLSFTAAFKQAGWLHAEDEELYSTWSDWCSQYGVEAGNDEGENLKLWNSIKDTEVGWKSIERRTPIKAYLDFGYLSPSQMLQTTTPSRETNITIEPVTEAVTEYQYGEILSEYDCQQYFKDCYFVERTGEIFNPNGRFMNQTKFNGRYGGKIFVITSQGKVTDIPWKAALTSTCWTIPKVDHVRFLPDHSTFEIIIDSLGRKGLNTYIPARIDASEGDVSPWLDFLKRVLPDDNDRRLLVEYMAHCVKYPGVKIPWAPLLQSTEGVGKTSFTEIMKHALGDMYVYSPKAPELVKSGSTFNGWMRGKLFISVDEIKIDERRELIEILKPMITDSRVEIQSKGVDQDMEDNPANWFFFSNYRDAIPITQNGRRYAIFYSALQSKEDVLRAGLTGEYFTWFWSWLRDNGGLQAVSYYLLNYPIKRGAISIRAPETSSHNEALKISRSPLEIVIAESIQDEVEGFRGGFISCLAVKKRGKEAGIRNITTRTAQTCLENMGFVYLGRANRPYPSEDLKNRAEVYGTHSGLNIDLFGIAQGYE